jgi:formylglycine-generating enzyme required for sulfatase activity
MRSTYLVSLATFVCALAPALLAQTAPGAPQAYRESIAGTVVTFEMVPVPGGTVTLSGQSVEVKPFLIGRTEVTWDMYDVYALGLDEPKGGGGTDAVARPSQPYGAPDYGWGHAGYPAISIARPAAQAFAAWLSTKTGKKYRLPTEAEWAHAAALAVGKEAATPDRIDALAWHSGNAAARTHPVGTKAADALGLFDLLGNAAEWVTTGVPGPGGTGISVTRGGSFRDAPGTLGPSTRTVQDDSWNERDPQLPKSRWWLSDGPFVGFRLVREP